MRRIAGRVCVVGVLLCGVSARSQAQDGLSLWQDVHVNPGTIAEYEELRHGRNARMAAAGVTYPIRVHDNEGVFRLVTPLASMADFDARQAQANPLRVANSGRAGEVIHHIDSTLARFRPDLSYRPTTPRVATEDIGFSRGFEYYVTFGGRAEAVELLQQIRAAFEAENAEVGYVVAEKVTGSGPDLSVFLGARDAADFYANYIGAIPEGVFPLTQRLAALCYRLENFNSNRREDLDYQPGN